MFFDQPTPVYRLDGTPQQVNDLTIVREGLDTSAPNKCRHIIVPATDQPLIVIDTLTYNDTSAPTTTHRSTSARWPRPPRLLPPPRSNETTLGKVPGLDLSDRSAGFANWSCSWKGKPEGSLVTLTLRLEDSSTIEAYESQREARTITGKTALIDSSDPRGCYIDVVHRFTATGIEVFGVDIEGPLAAEQRCTLATELAAVAEERLPD